MKTACPVEGQAVFGVPLCSSFPCALLRVLEGDLVLDSLLGVLGERLVFQQQNFRVRVEAFLLQPCLLFRAAEDVVRGDAKRIGNQDERLKVRLAGARLVFGERGILNFYLLCQIVPRNTKALARRTQPCPKIQNAPLLAWKHYNLAAQSKER